MRIDFVLEGGKLESVLHNRVNCLPSSGFGMGMYVRGSFGIGFKRRWCGSKRTEILGDEVTCDHCLKSQQSTHNPKYANKSQLGAREILQ